MKKLIVLFTAIVLVSGFTSTVNAQVGVADYAKVSATIITPLTITKTVDMKFGNIAVNATAGTVVLLPAGTRSSNGGVTLTNQGVANSPTAAQFNVTGLLSGTYTITLPTTDYIITNTTGTGAETMKVNAFSSTPATTGALSVGGTQTIQVGATLNVGASQVAGVYTAATGFPVTVNYN
jgi:hypothetical protein